MKISLITVNLNNLDGLRHTFESVVRQNCRNFEWIVIDGGSTDGSREFVESNRHLFSSYCSEPDGGIYEGMNKGIARAAGDYVLFLNSSDTLAADNVLAQASALMGEADIYVGAIARKGEGSTIMALPCPSLASPDDVVDKLLFSAFPHQGVFLRRALFDRYGPYDTRFRIAADWCHNVRALISGNASVATLPFVVAVFDTSGVSSAHPQRMYAERARFLSEYPSLNVLCNFYMQNVELSRAMRSNRLFFAVVRLMFYLKRRFPKFF